MLREKLAFMPERAHVTLDCYINELGTSPRDAILVIPGGAYACVCEDREGGPIALAYYLQGMNAFVLNYSVDKQISKFTDPLEEASRALIYIRKNAGKFNINPEHVYVVGFSAGGHLAGWLGCDWDCEELKALIPDKGELNRPTGAVLCYPVISARFENGATFKYLWGKTELTQGEKDRTSLEKRVSSAASPMFIMQTFDDGLVDCRNALYMAEACADAGVVFEMHVYPFAPHGAALATDVTSRGFAPHENERLARWVGDSRAWMKEIG